MKKTVEYVIRVLLIWAASAAAPATEFSSFDSNTDGWVVVDLADSGPYTTPVGSFSATYLASGGNPGGCVSSGDPSSATFYWQAPARFLGNQSGSYGLNLLWDQRHDGSATWDNKVDLVLVGAGLTLIRTTGVVPVATWKTSTVKLTETGWHLDLPTGIEPTAAQFKSALASLSALRIRGEFTSGNETDYLDNVRLVSVPKLTIGVTPAQSAAIIAFTAETNQSYTLVTSTNAAAPLAQWQVLSNWTGTGLAVSYLAAPFTSAVNRFYAVRMP